MPHKLTILLQTIVFVLFGAPLMKDRSDKINAQENCAEQRLRDLAVVPNGIGANVFFDNTTKASDEELRRLNESGMGIVRLGYHWTRVMKSNADGGFTFRPSAYETLLNRLQSNGFVDRQMNILFVIKAKHKLINGGEFPTTVEDKEYFFDFVKQSMLHFRKSDFNIIWEMENEPNHLPQKPDWANYRTLAKNLGARIRKDPDLSGEFLIGASIGRMDFGFTTKAEEKFPFLRSLLEKKALDDYSAISIHPYRQPTRNDSSGINDYHGVKTTEIPETALRDYNDLQSVMTEFGLETMPVLSTEWGYSTGGDNGLRDDYEQARFAARTWLTNTCADVPLSIWFNYVEKVDAKITNRKKNYGLLTPEISVRGEPLLDSKKQYEQLNPKPAFAAFKTVCERFAGFRATATMVDSNQPGAFALLLQKDDQPDQYQIAVWTTEEAKTTITIDPSNFEPLRYVDDDVDYGINTIDLEHEFDVVQYLGEDRPAVTGSKGLLQVECTTVTSPLYLRIK